MPPTVDLPLISVFLVGVEKVCGLVLAELTN